METFRLSFCKVTISLNFSLNVLEFRLELLLGLDSFHEHDLVVLVHLLELIVHIL